MNDCQKNESNSGIKKRKQQPALLEPARPEHYQGGFLRFCQILRSFRQRDVLLQSIAELIPQLLVAQGGIVLLLDEQTNELYIPSAKMDDAAQTQRLKSIRIKMEAPHPDTIFQNRAPIEDVPSESLPIGFQQLQEQLQDWTRNRLAVPLRSNEVVVGALWAINKINGEFTTEDTQLLSAVSGVAEMSLAAIDARQQLEACNSDTDALCLAKDRAAHHLSHAIKTPLAVLIASLKLLERHLEQSTLDGWHTIFQRAQRNLDRLLTIEYEVEDILQQRTIDDEKDR